MKMSAKFLIGWVVLNSGAAFAQNYTVQHVHPAISDALGFEGRAINDGGSTIGSAEVSGRGYAAYVGSTDAVVRIVDSRRSPDYYGSGIKDINTGSLGAGFVYASGTQEIAALFTYAGPVIQLGLIPGTSQSRAEAVNDTGWVVGESWQANGNETAFVWIPNPGTLNSGMMYPLPCTATRAVANTVNRDGLIGGSCGGKAYLWWYGAGYDISSWLPSLLDLGNGFGVYRDLLINNLDCEVAAVADSYAYAVNCSGYYSNISFVATPAYPSLTQLPGLSVSGSGLSRQIRINAINNAGCAVGESNGAAIKYCSGALTDLNAVVITKTATHLTTAQDINNRGQILASNNIGMWSPFYETAILTPSP